MTSRQPQTPQRLAYVAVPALPSRVNTIVPPDPPKKSSAGSSAAIAAAVQQLAAAKEQEEKRRAGGGAVLKLGVPPRAGVKGPARNDGMGSRGLGVAVAATTKKRPRARSVGSPRPRKVSRRGAAEQSRKHSGVAHTTRRQPTLHDLASKVAGVRGIVAECLEEYKRDLTYRRWREKVLEFRLGKINEFLEKKPVAIV
ncbi:hypothetical protein HYDPIDRAFT_167727 [Hydnomerulius pinastri MD-312]|uniref:Uncharacterized protein n=1 Tax=Hydnomerulius pinastri MD-312 TaxID=994086 RepID=A0A0C9WAI4_9AGAM|nr:hypothetical protein HYDPIDRAFT_167727 [Hydnomerulius pinastri MD-312]